MADRLNITKTRVVAALVASLVSAAAVAGSSKDGLYKWVDDNGVTHYGDRVPPEYAHKERYVLNERAVRVEVLPAEKTAEELAEEARQAELAALARRAAEAQAERDRILLDTYLSVEEIEMLRDRRVTALDAQIGVAEHYLKNLRQKWTELQKDAAKYNYPYREDSELPPLPDDLERHITHTQEAMDKHHQTLRALRLEQDSIHQEFAANIDRFRSLKGL